MRLNVYGKEIEIERHESEWRIFYVGNEGKKRKAEDIKIPSNAQQHELVELISDLCHEWSRPGYTEVTILEKP